MKMKKKTKFQELVEYLSTKLSTKIVYISNVIMHISSDGNANTAGFLTTATEIGGLQYENFNILHEQETKPNEIKFINNGFDHVNKMLAKKFGGRVNFSNSWVLYNEPIGASEFAMYGYRGKTLPTADEIIKFIEENSTHEKLIEFMSQDKKKKTDED